MRARYGLVLLLTGVTLCCTVATIPAFAAAQRAATAVDLAAGDVNSQQLQAAAESGRSLLKDHTDGHKDDKPKKHPAPDHGRKPAHGKPKHHHPTRRVPTAAPTDAPTAAPRADFKITFMHFNDIHARVEPANSGAGPCTGSDLANGLCYGGFARMAAQVKAAKDNATNDVIVLDAGDQFVGTVWDVVYKGNEAPPFQKLMGVQAMTVGNHEWDYGPDALANFTMNENVTFPILACNVDASRHPVLSQKIKPYTIITTPSGIKVGVVGFTTPDTPFLSSPGPNITFAPLTPSVQNAVNEVRAKGVDIVVGLSHIGYTVDQEVARNVTGLDLIIGGHSHSFLFDNSTQPLPQLNANTSSTDAANLLGPYPTITPLASEPSVTTPIVTAFWASRYLGRFDAVFDGPSGKLKSIAGNPILLGESGSGNPVTPDPEAQALIDDLAPPVRALGLMIIGSTAVRLDGDTRLVRSQETNLGDIVADSMVASIGRTMFSQAGYGPLWIALTNGGGIRASIQAPGGIYPYNITQNDVLTVLPFGNYISVKLVTGQQLVDALENGVSQIESTAGRFPQVSGIRFGFDTSKPAGSRIVRSTLQVRSGANGDYAAVDLAANYPLATNNFMSAGGDGYTALQAATTVYESGEPLDQATGQYIAAKSPINQATDGRSVNCANTPSSNLCIAPVA